MNNFEIITTTDKARRDEMFQDLRRNGNKLERKVVKFSSAWLQDDGTYISNWSVAYPRS